MAIAAEEQAVLDAISGDEMEKHLKFLGRVARVSGTAEDFRARMASRWVEATIGAVGRS